MCVVYSCGGDDAEEDGDNTDKLKNQTITVNGVSFKMIGVEDGTFQMGSPEGDADASDDEYPQHEVTLSSCCIGETEVTQELCEAAMGNNPYSFKGAKLPVDHERQCWGVVSR